MENVLLPFSRKDTAHKQWASRWWDEPKTKRLFKTSDSEKIPDPGPLRHARPHHPGHRLYLLPDLANGRTRTGDSGTDCRITFPRVSPRQSNHFDRAAASIRNYCDVGH